MKKLFTKRLIALLAVFAVTFGCIGNVGFSFASAEEAGDLPKDEIVMQTISEDMPGFSMTVAGAANGAGAQITQEAVAFNHNYLALRLISTYVNNVNGDLYFPVQIFVNGTLVDDPSGFIALPTYNVDGTQAEAPVEIKWGGWAFITPDFDGYIYIPATILNITELTSLKIAFDGMHDGELVLTDVFGCKNAGERLGAPIINEKNLLAESKDGVTISDGFKLDYTNKGSGTFGSVTATHEEIAFESEYLAVDLTVNSVAVADPYAVFELKINDALVGTLGDDVIASYDRSEAGIVSVENKWSNWFFIPAGFDGILYLPKALIGNPSSISGFSIRFDDYHSASVTVNSMFGCDNVGADFVPHAGTQFSTTDETVTIDATTVENTVADGALRTATVTTSNTLPMSDSDYVAVSFKMDSTNYPWGGPSAEDPNTYIKFSVNGILLPELGDVTIYPTEGEALTIGHMWGNWLLIPYDFEGMFYFPVSTYLAGQTELRSFTFTFNENQTQKIEYKVGVAKEIGGEVTYLDLASGGEAEIVKPLLNLNGFKAASEEVVSVMPVIGYTADEGIVADQRVTADEGVIVFDTFSYSYIKFGGIYLPEEWEDQLVISVKTAFEGGQAINPDDADEDYGYLEFDLGEDSFEMASGLALNVLCVSPECYFRVYVIDENGAVWIADHFRTDYTCVADRVPVGMSTMFNNFFFGEGYYGSLYIQKEWFTLTDKYNGELLTQEATEMGKVTKIVIGLDHLWGLGRSMCVGRMANVDIENQVFTTVFNPATMSDVELGVGASGGTRVSCPGTEVHVNNFALRRLLLEETPGYEEPEEADNPDNPNDSSEIEVPSDSSAPVVGNSSEPVQSCASSLSMGGMLSLALLASAVCITKRKKQ